MADRRLPRPECKESGRARILQFRARAIGGELDIESVPRPDPWAPFAPAHVLDARTPPPAPGAALAAS